jgi:hypothetical protein
MAPAMETTISGRLIPEIVRSGNWSLPNLPVFPEAGIVGRMSALEMIEQIKSLPPEEPGVVAAFVENLKAPASPLPDRLANDDKFEEAANHVFENHGSLLERLAK